jgi:hypothetical protein
LDPDLNSAPVIWLRCHQDESDQGTLSFPMTKKRKLSGLSSLELQMAFNSLYKLKQCFIYEDISEEETALNKPPVPDLEEEIDKMLFLLGSRLDGPRV